MSNHLQHQIEQLKRRVLNIGASVEEAIANAVYALEHRDEHLARRVIASDTEVDRMEVDLEEECLKILALYQPVAGDLRFVVGVLKMTNDLERMGDLAKNIAKRVLALNRSDPLPFSVDFRPIAAKSQEMVRLTLDALLNGDAALAQQVREQDDALDAMRREVHERVLAAVREHPDRTDTLLKLDSVAKHLERLGDMATNVAEDIIYMVQGNIVRHQDEA